MHKGVDVKSRPIACWHATKYVWEDKCREVEETYKEAQWAQNPKENTVDLNGVLGSKTCDFDTILHEDRCA